MADVSMLIRGRRLVAALGGPAFRRLMRGRLKVLAQGINQTTERATGAASGRWR